MPSLRPFWLLVALFLAIMLLAAWLDSRKER